MTKICGDVVTSLKSLAPRNELRLGGRQVSALAIAIAMALATTISAPAVASESHHHGGGGYGGRSHARSASISSSGRIGSGSVSGSRGYYGRGSNSYARAASISSGHIGSGSSGYYGRGGGGHGYFGGGGFRPFGPAIAGFGFLYDSLTAWPFLGLAAWELANYSYLNEPEVRAQENAVVDATSGPINQANNWDDGTANGTVTPIREGHTPDGQACREFQQQVTVDGQTQQAIGTACQQPDGSWQIVNRSS